MGCSLDSGAVTKEEEEFITREEAAYLHKFKAEALDETVHRYTSDADVSASQLTAIVEELTEDAGRRRGLFALLTGLERPVLLVFVILLGRAADEKKAELLFEVGTDSLATDVLTKEQAETLAGWILTAAVDVGQRLSPQAAASEYVHNLNRCRELAAAQLVNKILGDQRQVNEAQFKRNYGDSSRLCSLAGVRQFILRCSEKARS